MRYSLFPKCTCGAGKRGPHYLNCDVMYVNLKEKMFPKKKKQFGIFYPLKRTGE